MQVEGRRGIVVIGAQKAASTSFMAAIAAQSSVASLGGEYFGFIERTDDEVTRRDLDERLARLPDRPAYAFKCASYLGQPTLPPRLAAALGELDIVVLLRDPVRRAVSAWYWYALCGFVPAIDHEVGLRRLLRGEIDTGRWPHAQEVLEWGEYGRLLEPWLTTFGPERVHVIPEFAAAEPETAAGALLRKLGLEVDETVGATPARLNEGIYSMTRVRWLRLRLPLRWQSGTDGVRRLGRPTRPFTFLLDAVITGIDRVLLRPVCRRSAPVSPGLRALLEVRYRVDQERLATRATRPDNTWPGRSITL